MEKKNSLRIYRRFIKEMKEEDYSGSLESMVWLRARTNSLNLGENSWQRNRDVCVGCSEERETLEHFILHCPRWEEWRIESRSLQRPRIEETDQVLGEFLFGGHENNTKKRTLLKMWNERQRLIRNNQENAETWKKSTQVGQWKENISETVIRKKENISENSDKEKYKW